MKNIVGSVPRGEDFFNREELIRLIKDSIIGHNILLIAPRRFGKTAIMYKILDQPPSGYKPIFMDCQGITNAKSFVYKLILTLLRDNRLRRYYVKAKTLPGRFRTDIPKYLEEIGIDILRLKLRKQTIQDWEKEGELFLSEAEKFDQTVIIILDEFPMMLSDMLKQKDGKSNVCKFLNWFRSVRITPQEKLRKLRFIVGGSVSMTHILRSLDLISCINDFNEIPVKEYPTQIAIDFIQHLAEQARILLSPHMTRKFLDLIGTPIPSYIQLYFSLIVQEPGIRRKRVSAKLLEHVYSERLLGPESKYFFQHYEDRLRQFGKTKERAAREILSKLAGVKQGIETRRLFDIYCRVTNITDKKGFDDLLADLETDFYIERSERTNKYKFKSKLLRDWWLRWHPSIKLGRH